MGVGVVGCVLGLAPVDDPLDLGGEVLLEASGLGGKRGQAPASAGQDQVDDLVPASEGPVGWMAQLACLSRNGQKIAKKPESYTGDKHIYSEVAQFDSTTGDDNLLADNIATR